jgi:hypothetical protein
MDGFMNGCFLFSRWVDPVNYRSERGEETRGKSFLP